MRGIALSFANNQKTTF